MLHLVDFLKTAFEDKNDPLNSSEAFKIVQTICKENRKFRIPLKSDERKQEFLTIAKEIRKNYVDYGIILGSNPQEKETDINKPYQLKRTKFKSS